MKARDTNAHGSTIQQEQPNGLEVNQLNSFEQVTVNIRFLSEEMADEIGVPKRCPQNSDALLLRGQICVSSPCVRGEGVQGVLTLFCSGVAQTCHDDRVVELKEQLGIEEEDGEGQEEKVREEGRDRVKENAP